MAIANRKLQSEIERVLKRVAEGVEIFEGIFEKIQSATNITQKEKFEGDLKKEIKKLQRYRDQIKTWLSSNEIKDKRNLLENRKLIEQQMEKFKACEKELKTKAYSKEGLSQSVKMDPAEKERMEISNWIQETVEKLGTQVDAFETEQEVLSAALRRSSKKAQDIAKAQRLAMVENQVIRHKHHVGKLEIILRMLENGNLSVEQVRGIRDDVNFYVDSNQDADFAEDEGIYDDLSLEEAEAYGFANEDSNDDDGYSGEDEPYTSPKEKEEPKNSEEKKKATKDQAEEIPSPSKSNAGKGNTAASRAQDKHKEEDRKPPLVPTAKAPVPNTPTKTVSTPTRTGSQSDKHRGQSSEIMPQRYAAAASSGNSEPARSTPAVVPAEEKKPIVKDSQPRPTATSTTNTSFENNSPTTSAPISSSSQTSQSRTTLEVARPSSDVPIQSSVTTVQQNPPVSAAVSTNAILATTQPNSSQSSDSSKIQTTPIGLSAGTPTGSSEIAPTPTKEEAAAPQETLDNRLPPSLADLVSSFESTKERSIKAREDTTFLHGMLETSSQFVPDSLDSERPKYYTAKHPYPTPGYYPQAPLAIFENPLMFDKFDVDTLFFIFYYQQATFQQYLSARELKRQSWRFHKKYMTWFQRHEEPKAITDEYEQGTYIYFDYEGEWCNRKKSEFRFEYRYLEDTELS